MDYDVLNNLPNKTIKCLDLGHVTLIDVMPRIVPEGQTSDYAIVQAARVSYGEGTKTINEDKGLIRYLMRHQHTTPFEMVRFKFHCKVPIFIARQWLRHRMCSINEISGRYSVMKDEFYFPNIEDIKKQSNNNKQGSEDKIGDKISYDFCEYVISNCHSSYEEYRAFIENEISREQARINLPLNLYTEFYWCIDLHNLFHFLALRCDSHAQQEIRVYSEAILKLIHPIIPFSAEAWNDYHPMRQAIKLTRLEIESLKKSLKGLKVSKINSDNKREQQEWMDKCKQLNLEVT